MNLLYKFWFVQEVFKDKHIIITKDINKAGMSSNYMVHGIFKTKKEALKFLKLI